jgi:plasmid stabilization system protein ParE
VKVIYLKEARPGIVWWYRYYGQVFPSGRSSAFTHFKATIGLLKKNPYLGRPVGVAGLRRLVVPNTPFIIFYRVNEQTIEIAKIRDGRSEPEPGFHEEQAPIT